MTVRRCIALLLFLGCWLLDTIQEWKDSFIYFLTQKQSKTRKGRCICIFYPNKLLRVLYSGTLLQSIDKDQSCLGHEAILSDCPTTIMHQPVYGCISHELNITQLFLINKAAPFVQPAGNLNIKLKVAIWLIKAKKKRVNTDYLAHEIKGLMFCLQCFRIASYFFPEHKGTKKQHLVINQDGCVSTSKTRL